MTFIVSVVKDNGLLFDINRKKETKTYTLDCDPLAVACAIYRLHLSQKSYPRSDDTAHELLEPGVQSAVTADDIAMATEIRNYYGAKFMMLALVQETMTRFRSDLASFIAGRKELTHEDLCMLYKVPHFYAYDRQLDQITCGLEFTSLHKLPDRFSGELTMVGVGMLTRKVRQHVGVTRQQFFFTAKCHGLTVPVMMQDHSTFMGVPMMEYAVKEGLVITLEGSFVKHRLDGKQYLTIAPKWKVLSMKKA